MTAGYPTTKGDIDARAGYLTSTLRDTLDQVVRFKDWLDTQSDADLTSRGYELADVNLLRASFTDLNNLNKVARAQGTQAQANDFFFNAKKLSGLL